jgi:uncharacterized protein YbjT (DUF2867 family)
VSGDRELDVVVFGATGFVGRLVAGYLAGHAPDGVRIGLAGRSAQRLADIRARLGAAASAWPLQVADSADPASVAAPFLGLWRHHRNHAPTLQSRPVQASTATTRNHPAPKHALMPLMATEHSEATGAEAGFGWIS